MSDYVKVRVRDGEGIRRWDVNKKVWQGRSRTDGREEEREVKMESWECEIVPDHL